MAVVRGIIIEYSFKVILAIIVVVVLVSILLIFRNNVIAFFESNFDGKKERGDVLTGRVNSMESLANYIIACYQRKIEGTCSYIYYSGSDINCDDLLSYVYSYERDMYVKNCDGSIPGDRFIEIIYRDPGIIELYIK